MKSAQYGPEQNECRPPKKNQLKKLPKIRSISQQKNGTRLIPHIRFLTANRRAIPQWKNCYDKVPLKWLCDPRVKI